LEKEEVVKKEKEKEDEEEEEIRLPHNQVHNDRTVPTISVILHIFHCACVKRPYFLFRCKIWRHHTVPRPQFL